MKKKALIIRFSSIGDIILTTPVVRSIHNSGDYEITFLTHQKYADVLASNPYISEIKGYDGNLFNTSQWIRSEKFDLIIDLHCSLRSHFLRIFSFERFHGYEKLRIKRWWRTKSKKALSPDRHIALRFLDSAEKLGFDSDHRGLEYFISDHNQMHLTEGPIRIALVTGARHYTKTIPLALSEKIITNHPKVEFHLLGGEIEQVKTQTLEHLPNVINHSGALNLEQSASIINQSDLVITTDTALMHIAAAFQKKIITIWGGTVPEFGFYPFIENGDGEYTVVENRDLSCRPCSKSGRSSCPLGHFKCMKNISTNRIESTIKEYLRMNHLDDNDVIME